MAKVQITAEINEELSERLTADAESRGQSVSEWVEELVLREIANRVETRTYRSDKRSLPPWIHPARPGEKPRGIDNPPRLRDGSTIAEVVIEDRR